MPSRCKSAHGDLKQTSNLSNPYSLYRKNSPELQRGAFRSGGRWKKTRAMYIKRHPLCEDPHGCHEACGVAAVAEEIHHIIRAQDCTHAEAFDFNNLAALCCSCHAKISSRERFENRSCPEFFNETN